VKEETMRIRALKRTCLAATQIIAIIVCLSATAAAQPANPSTQPSPTPTAGDGISYADALATFTNRAFKLLDVFQNEIQEPLLPRFQSLSLLLGGLIAIAAFARLWRENAGAGEDLFWWFGRLGLILALLGKGPMILDGMADTGKRIVAGNYMGNIGKLREDQCNAFDSAYREFTEGTFEIRDESVKFVPGGRLGVPFSGESNATDPNRKVDAVTVNMSKIFDWVNFSRGVISFGDLFLILLEGFLMIVMKLAAPVMIALAIDRNLAQRITYPYLWGAVVLTLIWPVVVALIKTLAYMGGNVAMALGVKNQHTFDQRTMQIINPSGSQPVYAAVLAAVIMLISGLALWMAPLIAYKLSFGGIYDAVTSAASAVGDRIQSYGHTAATSMIKQSLGLASAQKAEGQPNRVSNLKSQMADMSWKTPLLQSRSLGADSQASIGQGGKSGKGNANRNRKLGQ
jgi:hypothetical protein